MTTFKTLRKKSFEGFHERRDVAANGGVSAVDVHDVRGLGSSRVVVAGEAAVARVRRGFPPAQHANTYVRTSGHTQICRFRVKLFLAKSDFTSQESPLLT